MFLNIHRVVNLEFVLRVKVLPWHPRVSEGEFLAKKKNLCLIFTTTNLTA